jgi:transposase
MSAMEVPTLEGSPSANLEGQYRFFIGIDWASEAHQACVVGTDGRAISQHRVAHTADSLRDFGDAMVALAEGHPESVAIAIETPRGALVETLVERGFHVYAINPKQLDRFRDRHTVAGAKDDRLDAFVLGDSLRTDQACFRRVRTDDPLVVQIRELSRAWDNMKEEQARLCNQLREQIYRCLPQLLELSPGADEPWLWELLELASSGVDPARIRPTQVQRILKSNRIRRFDAEDLLTRLRQQPPWTTPGTQQAVRSHIALLLPRLRTTAEQNRACKRQIELLLEQLAEVPAEGEIREHRGDVRIIQSLPGAGTTVVATMLAEASQPLADRDYHLLRSQGGAAPVTKSTGKRSKARATVVMRYACNGRLRNAFFHWAKSSVQRDPAAQKHYAALRERGHTHGRALRGVADRLLRILVAMLKTGTLYDPGHRTIRQPAMVTP